MVVTSYDHSIQRRAWPLSTGRCGWCVCRLCSPPPTGLLYYNLWGCWGLSLEPLFLSFLLFSFRDKVSNTPGWPPTMDLAEDALELLILLPLPAKHWEYYCVAHTRFYVVLKMGPGALHVLSKLSTSPAPCLISESASGAMLFKR